MSLPPDKKIRAIFLKTYRELTRFTDDNKQKVEIFNTLHQFCFQTIQYKYNFEQFLPINLKSKILQKGENKKFRDRACHLIGELRTELEFYANFPSVIGSLYELRPEFIEIKKRTEKEDNQKYGDFHNIRKKTGQFFTPLSVADFIARKAIDFYLEQNNDFPEELHILDPSAGCGIFLDVAINHLKSKYEYSLLKRICLYGIDKDSLALKFCKKALKHKCRDSAKVTFKILNKDFLLNEIYYPKDGYQIIIGNPPYIPYYSRESHPNETYKNCLKERYGNIAGGSLNTFLHFIVRGIDLLSDGGILGYIVPDKLLWNRRYQKIRSYIFENAGPIAIFNAGEGIFDDASVGNAIIFLKKKNRENFCQLADLVICRDSNEISSQNHKKVKIDHFKSNPYYRFAIRSSLIQKIEENSIPLNNLVYIKDGINTGYREFRNQIISTSRLNENYRPLIEGEDIHPFKIRKRKLFINYNLSLVTHEMKKRGVSLRKEWIFNAPVKLVNRQTSDKLIFALDTEQLCNLNSVHNTILREGIDDEMLIFLLGLMNSKLMNFYYQEVSHETGKSFPQVHIAELKTLPIRIPSRDKLNSITNLVQQILSDEEDKTYLLMLLDDEIFKLYGINEKDKMSIIKSIGNEWRCHKLSKIKNSLISLYL